MDLFNKVIKQEADDFVRIWFCDADQERLKKCASC